MARWKNEKCMDGRVDGEWKDEEWKEGKGTQKLVRAR